jgi:hypothetical protein
MSEPMVADLILAKKVCFRCGKYETIPHADKKQPAIRYEWVLNKTTHFTMAHPYAKRTGGELCYFCEKIENNLIKPIAVR